MSPKRKEIVRWNTVTHHLLILLFFLKACDNVLRVTNIFPNSEWDISENYLHAVVNKKKHWGLPACFRQNKSSINIHKC